MKTQKDRLIESLKSENEFLNSQIDDLKYALNKVEVMRNNISTNGYTIDTLYATCLVPDELVQTENHERIHELVVDKLLRTISTSLTPYLEIDSAQDFVNCGVRIRGTIKVVKNAK